MAEEAVVVKLRAEIKDLKAKMKQSQTLVKKTTKKMSGDFNKLGKDIVTGFVAALSIRTLGRGIKNLSEMAAKAEGVTDSFDRMVESAGKSADVFRNELRQASRGTISDLQLMTKTNQALILLGKESVSEIPKLIQIARASAKATGESVDFLFDSIVLGLGRQSKMILDNLGIMVSVEDANKKYAESLGITSSELTDAQKKQAFFNATMAAGDKIISAVGDSTDLAVDAQARMNASLENAGLELGKVLLPRWQKFVTLIGTTVSKGGVLIKVIDFLIRAVEDFGASAGTSFLKVLNFINLVVARAKALGIFMANVWKNPKGALDDFVASGLESLKKFDEEGTRLQADFAEKIREIWKETEKEKTKTTKSGVRERTEAAIAATNKLKQIGKSEIDFFREKSRVTVTMMQALTTQLSSVAEEFTQKAEETNEAFVQRVKEQQDLVRQKADATFTAIQTFAQGATETFAENFTVWTEQMKEGTFDVAEAFKRLGNSMLKFLLQAVGKGLIQQAAAKVAEGIAASLSIFGAVAAPGLFAGAAKLAAAGGIILGAASAIRLAKGGLVTKPTSAIIGEAGPELVVPLDKLGALGGVDMSGSTFPMIFPNVRREEDLKGTRFSQTAARELAKITQDLNQRSGIKRRSV